MVFGKVLKGQDVVRAMENVEMDGEKPKKDVVIADCGEIAAGQPDGVPEDGDTLPAFPGIVLRH